MAKSKRKPSLSQLDPKNKEIAKKLKAAGILSPRANLRKKAISRGVLKKVQAYEWVTKNNYKAVKVKPQELMAAKLQGLETVGRKIIVPKDGRSERRLREGIVTGVRSIPGGNMQIVVLPYNSLTQFLMALRRGDVDRLKADNEDFAFTFYGNKSMQAFRNSAELLEFFIRYEAITNPITGALMSDRDKHYSNFTLFRVLRGKYNPPEFDRARYERRMRREANDGRREQQLQQRKSRRVADMSADARFQKREAERIAQKKYRENMTPEKLAEYRRKSRERVRLARERKKEQ